VPAQLGSEISEIGVAITRITTSGRISMESSSASIAIINVHVRLVMTFFGGRTIFGHDHESVGAQANGRTVFLVPLVRHVGMAGGSPA